MKQSNGDDQCPKSDMIWQHRLLEKVRLGEKTAGLFPVHDLIYSCWLNLIGSLWLIVRGLNRPTVHPPPTNKRNYVFLIVFYVCAF